MAKKPTKNQKAQKGKGKKQPQSPKQLLPGNKNAEYLQLVLNPTTASFTGGYLPGESGITQRFFAELVLNNFAATDTSGVYLYCAANNSVWYHSGNASNTAITPVFGSNSNAPGYTYLSSSADRHRTIAAHVGLLPHGATADAMTGEVCCGHLSTSAAGKITSVDMFFQAATSRDVLKKRTYQVLWRPNSDDVKYADFTGETFDRTESNVTFIAWRGAPAGKAMTARVTSVIEWVPKANASGLQTSTPADAPVDAIAIHQQVAKKHGHHAYHNFVNGVLEDVSSAARRMVRTGLVSVTRQAESYLLGAGPATLALM